MKQDQQYHQKQHPWPLHTPLFADMWWFAHLQQCGI